MSIQFLFAAPVINRYPIARKLVPVDFTATPVSILTRPFGKTTRGFSTIYRLIAGVNVVFAKMPSITLVCLETGAEMNAWRTALVRQSLTLYSFDKLLIGMLYISATNLVTTVNHLYSDPVIDRML